MIHAGFYYPSDSLKAKLCVRGNALMYELCAAHAIPHRRVGKIVVANSDDEVGKVHALLDQGRKNGVPGLTLLSRDEVVRMEPAVRCSQGLFSPSTGIVDTHSLMKHFEAEAESHSVIIAYNCPVRAVAREDGGYRVFFRDADGADAVVRSDILINCAGLGSGDVAAWAGIDVDREGYRIHPCKGEYFSVSNRHRGRLSHLVYPAPSSISLGLHAVLKLDGSLKLGPNAFYVDALDYGVDPAHQREFFDKARLYLPFLAYDDLSPDMSGIRPKTQAPGVAFRDFIIRDESDKNLPGFINLVGIESPGLTAAPAIAEMVAGIVERLQAQG